MKRLFVAIKIDPDPGFLQVFRTIKSCLGQERIKWVEENNLHLTLKFLGETPEEAIPNIKAALEPVTGVVRPFDYSLKGLGVFGSRYSPRVIWTGLEPSEKFTFLMKDIKEKFELIGIPGDRQNLVPHLTLGRIKSIADRIIFQRTIDRFGNYVSLTYKAESVILYESILTRTGPEYHILQKYLFNKEFL